MEEHFDITSLIGPGERKSVQPMAQRLGMDSHDRLHHFVRRASGMPRRSRPNSPEPIKDWSLTGLKKKLIKVGAKVVSHGRYVSF